MSLSRRSYLQRPLTVAKTPTHCKTCLVALSSPEAFRAHLKSEDHVMKLRASVADPLGRDYSKGITMAEWEKRDSENGERCTRTPGRKYQPEFESDDSEDLSEEEDDSEDDSEQDSEEEEDDAYLPAPGFTPSKCLFCSHDSSSSSSSSSSNSNSILEANLSHMSLSHGFKIPFQTQLKANISPQTVLEYLHLTIHSYNECIACNTRRHHTVEAVQHHMKAKGHCTFTLTPETTSEFYNLPEAAIITGVEQSHTSHENFATTTRLLPSGKVISHRHNHDSIDDGKRTERRAAGRSRYLARWRQENYEILREYAPPTMIKGGYWSGTGLVTTAHGQLLGHQKSSSPSVTTCSSKQPTPTSIPVTNQTRLNLAKNVSLRRRLLKQWGTNEFWGELIFDRLLEENRIHGKVAQVIRSSSTPGGQKNLHFVPVGPDRWSIASVSDDGSSYQPESVPFPAAWMGSSRKLGRDMLLDAAQLQPDQMDFGIETGLADGRERVWKITDWGFERQHCGVKNSRQGYVLYGAAGRERFSGLRRGMAGGRSCKGR